MWDTRLPLEVPASGPRTPVAASWANKSGFNGEEKRSAQPWPWGKVGKVDCRKR